MTISLVASGLHFLQDSPADLCLHGSATLSVDGEVRHTGECTVFGAAVYALRSLSGGYPTEQCREPFFPCCANGIYAAGPGEDAVVTGCPFGDALTVKVSLTTVELSTRQWQGRVSFGEWQQAVFAFVDQIAAFYQQAPPREPSDETDEAGWRAVLDEWQRRRGAPMLG